MDLSHTPRPKPDDNSEQVNLDAEEKILRKAALAAGGPDPKAPEKD